MFNPTAESPDLKIRPKRKYTDIRSNKIKKRKKGTE